jgi:predicted LPLAT superfamily acyltransferase
MNAARWTRQAERGSPWIIHVMIWIIRNLPWHVGYAILTPITLYFFVTSRRARVTSRDYLRRVLGREPGWGEIYRHCFTYSAANMDRVLFLSDRAEEYEIEIVGLDLIKRLIEEGRGGILLGAHFGSFDALRLVGRKSPVAVRPLMHKPIAGTLSLILDELDPKLRKSVIEIGSPDVMLQVREALERGEFVGILGDRTPADQRSVLVPFFGDEAPFPAGPIALAATLHAPVVLVYGVRAGRRRYEVGFQLFAEEIFLGRATRSEDLRHWIGLYAAWLEGMCRRHPYNWFNFHEFWDKPPDAPPNR